MNKDYADNFISDKPSTKVHHAPGGKSSMGNLLGGGFDFQKNRENEQKNNNNSDTNNGSNPGNFLNNTAVNIDGNIGSTIKSDAEHVREFTKDAGQYCADKPFNPMTTEEVEFIGKMIIDEVCFCDVFILCFYI